MLTGNFSLEEIFNNITKTDSVLLKADQPDKISFFCGTSALVVTDDPNNPKNPSGKKTYNPVVGIGALGNGTADCDPEGVDAGVKAWTARQNTPNGNSYIVFCSWYLEYLKIAKEPTSTGLGSTIIKKGVRALDVGLSKITLSTPAIDTFALLEQTVFHEVCIANLAHPTS